MKKKVFDFYNENDDKRFELYIPQKGFINSLVANGVNYRPSYVDKILLLRSNQRSYKCDTCSVSRRNNKCAQNYNR